jgi:hypothetical protein
MMTVEQALRKEVAVLHKRNAALKKRIKLFTATCEKRKELLRENHRFLSALKRRNAEIYADVVAEITGIGPTKSCYECREDGMDCPENTARRGKDCMNNLKEKHENP